MFGFEKHTAKDFKKSLRNLFKRSGQQNGVLFVCSEGKSARKALAECYGPCPQHRFLLFGRSPCDLVCSGVALRAGFCPQEVIVQLLPT